MDYEVTIGIEIHCELKTTSKMFTPSKVSFNDRANTHVSEVDLAFPGVLPTINKKAVEYSLMVCHALSMEIDPLLRFDRKNYFYTDLPKGYQITQQFYPLGKNGQLVLEDGKTINITRLHMEEDTAKQFHRENQTLIDFNRAGVPLIEIVSEPEIHSAKEAAMYVSSLRQLLLYLDVSDVKMEEGSLRCDVNISLARPNEPLGTKVEIKNLNSINNIQKAIECEIARQTELLDKGERIDQATRRFDESLQQTVEMRKKEGVVDYRYFPDPNLVPIQLDQQWIDDIQNNLVELPQQRRERYLCLGLVGVNANILVNNKSLSDFYDAVVSQSCDPLQSANYLISEVLSLVEKDAVVSDVFDACEMATLLKLLKDNTLSSKQSKQVLPELVNKHKRVEQVMKEKNLVQISDPELILRWIEDILEKNPQVITDFKNGKDNSVKFVMGQVMKVSKGQANPALSNQLVIKTLQSK